jgi:hypothetical protein
VHYDMMRNDARISAVFIAPIDRLETVPTWGKAIALIAAMVQFVQQSAFVSALLMVLLASLADYLVGVRAARLTNSFNPLVAKKGLYGKIVGVFLLFAIRGAEGFLSNRGWAGPHGTHGMAATAVAISLFAVEVQSIAHSRELLGAAPIPVLGKVLEWLQRFADSKVPDPPDPANQGRRSTDVQPPAAGTK